MKSIFRYPGGKTRSTVQGWIRSHRPAGVREYREPFVGGGGVFFAIEAREIPLRWINDANAGLISVYRALADRPAEFAALCRSIEPARPDDPLTGSGSEGGLPQNARLKSVFDSLATNPDCDQALRYFFVNRTVFAGRVNYDRPSRLYFSKPEGWDLVRGDRLERAAAHVTGTRITCGDFAPVLSESGEGVWIYADPPYYRDTKFTGNSKLYQHGFSVEDHRRLATAVRGCEHAVALSYDDDPEGFVRSLYEGGGFRLVENSWAYCGSTNATKDRGRELLILNYEPPGQRAFSFPEPCGEVLGPAEAEALATHEGAIDHSLRSCFAAGAALKAIRDGRLYRETDRTFEAYCRRRWGMSRQRANQFIDCSTIEDSLTTIVVKPATESQARELAALRDGDGSIDAAKVAEVWSEVVASSGRTGRPVTARLIREHVRAAAPAPAGGEETPARAAPDIARIVRDIETLDEEAALLVFGRMRKLWPHLFGASPDRQEVLS